MILDLFSWLLGSHLPQIMLNTSTRMILALLTSLLFSILLGPSFIRKLYSLKVGQTIRKEECPLLGKLHHKKQDTPTMGGILILASMLLSLFLWMDPTNIFTWILLFTTLFLGVVGGYDDYLKLRYKNTKGLSAKKKLFLQAVLSLVVVGVFFASDSYPSSISSPVVKESIGEKTTSIAMTSFLERIYLPFKEAPILEMGTILTLLWSFLVISGTSNAVNLTDGLDGLASGCLIMAASCFVLLAFVSNNIDLATYLHLPYISGSGEVGIYLAAMIGAILGFLWYNGHPAQVFMGDIGSLTLGGVLGVSSLMLKRELLLALVGGVFVVEALSVILQVLSYKYRNQRRIFLIAPLHHHFEYKGWPETKVVVRFWIVALILSLIGIISLKLQLL